MSFGSFAGSIDSGWSSSRAALKTKIQAARASARARNPIINGNNTALATVTVSTGAPTTTGMTQHPPRTDLVPPYAADFLIEGGILSNPYGSAVNAYGVKKDQSLPVDNTHATNAIVSGFSFSSETTSASVIYQLACDGTYPIRVLIDDVYVDAAGISPGGNTNINLTVTPTVAGLHEIKIECQSSMYLYKAWASSDAAWFKPLPRPRGIILTDSYGYAISGNTSAATTMQGNGLWKTVGKVLGHEIVCNAIGGTGLLATNAPSGKYHDRLADVQAAMSDRAADWLVIQGSVNDVLQGFSAAAVAAEMVTLIQALRALYPTLPIITTGIYPLSGANAAASAAMEAAMSAAIAGLGAGSLCAFNPVQGTQPYVPVWTAGNALVAADGVHLTPLGQMAGGIRAANDLYASLMAMAA